MNNTLIRGGSVVDGTGAPAFAADVRVRNGRIAEVAPGLQPEAGEHVVDASGCYVAPGFIETHTHFDANMWWQPDLDPLPGYGVTTTILHQQGDVGVLEVAGAHRLGPALQVVAPRTGFVDTAEVNAVGHLHGGGLEQLFLAGKVGVESGGGDAETLGQAAQAELVGGQLGEQLQGALDDLLP